MPSAVCVRELVHRYEGAGDAPQSAHGGRMLRCGCSANAVWTYEIPFAAVAEIKDHLAFYPDRVDAIEVRPAA
jgi:hypothetical protein